MKTYLTSAFLLLIGPQLFAQYYFKKFDVNPGTASSNPSDFVSYESTLLCRATGASPQNVYSISNSNISPVSDLMTNAIYQTTKISGFIPVINGKKILIGNDAATGYEIWTSDGTQAGTSLLKDINPGTASGIKYNDGMFTMLNNKVYFAADDGVNGTELWVSDGTTAGTFMLKDINNYSTASSYPLCITALNNKIIFSALDNAGNGKELWVSDGTAGGTMMLKDIFSGQSSSNIFTIIPLGNNVLLGASSVNEGTELWISDGTPAGTKLLKDIYPGIGSSLISLNGQTMNGKFYFSARDADGDYMWVTDGTSAGTVPLTKGKAKFANNSPIIRYNNKIYFSGYDDTHGSELWATDGTAAGTTMVKEIFPDNTLQTSPASFAIFDGRLYFTAFDYKRKLFRTDGTAAGTESLEPTGALYTKSHLQSSLQLFVHNRALYFLAEYDDSGKELWALTPFPESIENTNTNNGIALYPNPSHNNFTIKTTTTFKTGHVTLIDLTGRVVKTQKLNTNIETISIEGIAPGIYIADVWLDDKRSTQKLVVE